MDADPFVKRLHFIVHAASRAPSLHNSQPWLFRQADGSAFELLADRTRQLQATDPSGRELIVSCGAALFNARLAVRLLGFEPEVALLPSAAEPDLLARIRLDRRRDATEAERRLFTAIPRRHTHRSSFRAGGVARDLLVGLQDAVAAEGAQLHLVERPGQRRALADLLTSADRRQRRDPAVQTELVNWTAAPGEARDDGVPPWVYAPPAEAVEPEAFPVRDFDAGRGWGTAEPRRPVGDAEIAVLTTSGDQLADWLAAGQALQRMLLLAATRWYFAALFTQPLELPEVRVLLRDEVGTSRFPQMLMQLGSWMLAPTTPRRPVSDLLLDDSVPRSDPPPRA